MFFFIVPYNLVFTRSKHFCLYAYKSEAKTAQISGKYREIFSSFFLILFLFFFSILFFSCLFFLFSLSSIMFEKSTVFECINFMFVAKSEINLGRINEVFTFR